MKVIIAGGRDFKGTRDDFELIERIHKEYEITEVVNGKAPGADAFGEVFAKFYGIPVVPFPANWDRDGLAAGPMRNREMAKYADALILFPGGRGTDSMRKEAIREGIKILYDGRNPVDYYVVL